MGNSERKERRYLTDSGGEGKGGREEAEGEGETVCVHCHLASLFIFLYILGSNTPYLKGSGTDFFFILEGWGSSKGQLQ